MSKFSVFDVMISTFTFGTFGFVLAKNRGLDLSSQVSMMTLFAIFGICVDVTLWVIKLRRMK